MQNKTEILSIELRNECLKKSSLIDLGKIKMLIALGADPNYRDGENKNTCLYILCDRLEVDQIVFEEQFHQYIEAIKFLLDNKADPNIKSVESGNTCLSKLCGNGTKETTEIIKLLLDYKADPNALNNYENNPLFDLCFTYGDKVDKVRIEHIKLLIKYKSDIKFDGNSKSVIYYIFMHKAIQHDISELGLLVILKQFQGMDNEKITLGINRFYERYSQYKNGSSLLEKLLNCMFENDNPKEIYEFIQKRFYNENGHFPKCIEMITKQEKSSVLSFMKCLHKIKTENPTLKLPKPIIFKILNENRIESGSKIIEDTLSEFGTDKLNCRN